MNASSLQQSSVTHTGRFATGYSLLLIAAVGLYALIRAFGEATFHVAPVAAEAAATHTSGGSSHGLLPQVICALIVVVFTGRLLGSVFLRFGQPRVIGEVVAGILLGPSLLGQISTPAMQWVFPSQIMPTLGILAQLGVILYMFLVGLELNGELIRKRAHTTVAISHASIVAPFLLGSILALWLFTQYAPSGVSFTSFSLFLGVAMSITAFPVLARILTDRKMEKSELGVIALSCAAADDVTAWCLLALVVGVTKAQVTGAVTTIVLSVGYMAFMLLIAKPLVVRLLSKSQPTSISPQTSAGVLLALLCSSLITEWIGIHAIFGAFLLGAIIPHDSVLASSFRTKLEDVVSILLLPTFFAFTGMRTEIGLLSQPSDWLICLVIILAATAGKFGGSILAGRSTGLAWRPAAALGILMNTRGLMELIVLNIGLELGVISPRLFAMMVIMALATTIATTPILAWLTREQKN